MKTKTQVVKDNGVYKTLINAVINRIGVGHVEDVNNYRADCGFSGFIYYIETHSFAMRHRKDIVRLLEDVRRINGC